MDFRTAYDIMVRNTTDHEWFLLCSCESPETAAEVIRILLGARATPSQEIMVRRVEREP